MMQYLFHDISAHCDVASFEPAGGVAEYHAILTLESRGELFPQQYARMVEAQRRLATQSVMSGATVVFRRYFLSDAVNQVPLMPDASQVDVSCIQQPPLNGSKIALWIYAQRGVTKTTEPDGTVVVDHNGYRQLWKMGMVVPHGDSASQTFSLLEAYEALLERHGASLANNCIRTWFYVRDVDTQYAGMVRARKANFEAHGLTSKTHYVSSTGIGGLPADPDALIQLGTFSLIGFQPEQQRYLYALSHLNRTIDYGVTFERGTLLEFGDRAHAYISGTASIDNKGNVLFPNDIRQQTQRMWENVDALLTEAQMSFEDVRQIIVYLRDVADYETVNMMFRSCFPNIPYVITLAPVCRPGWLIEMECIAIRGRRNKDFRNF